MKLFLPIVCLIAVLLSNLIKTPDFFKIAINNGVLYGYIIDVINRASELVILAVGMTLVTAASGGQDISVGAVMAVRRRRLPDSFRRRYRRPYLQIRMHWPLSRLLLLPRSAAA